MCADIMSLMDKAKERTGGWRARHTAGKLERGSGERPLEALRKGGGGIRQNQNCQKLSEDQNIRPTSVLPFRK